MYDFLKIVKIKMINYIIKKIFAVMIICLIIYNIYIHFVNDREKLICFPLECVYG